MTQVNTSEIVVNKDGGAVCYSGPDAVDIFRLKTLRNGIDMHKKFGMIPTRGVTITKMLAMVTAFSGKTYKGKTKHDAAMADLDARINGLMASMPIVERA